MKTWMWCVLLGAILLVPSIHAKAADDSWDGVFATTGFRSRHDAGAGKGKVDQSGRQVKDYNKNNQGVGVVLRFHEDYSLTMGTYFNSLYQDTVYMGFGYQPYHYRTEYLGTWSAGVVTVLATGYNKSDKVLVPLPVINYQYSRVGINFVILPSIVYSAQLQFKLN